MSIILLEKILMDHESRLRNVFLSNSRRPIDMHIAYGKVDKVLEIFSYKKKDDYGSWFD